MCWGSGVAGCLGVRLEKAQLVHGLAEIPLVFDKLFAYF